MVLNAEGALDITKEDYILEKYADTKQNRVKITAKRVNKKGYEVLDYGILYNSD